MEKILFPTDYSETANNAYRYALHLANKQEAELYVLHVYDPPVISGHIPPTMVDTVHYRYNFQELSQIEEHHSLLKQIQQQMNKENVKVFLKVKPGLLKHEIKTAVAEYDIDYIVMGTDGSTGYYKKFIGTNTLNTIDNVSIPVLSIPKEAKFRKVKSVIHLTGFNLDEEQTTALISKGAKERKLKVKCVHLKRKHFKEYEDRVSQWKEKYEHEWFSFHLFSSEKSVYDGIVHYLKKEHFDLVSIAHRHRHFFEKLFSNSLTIQLGKDLNVPLLVYRKEN